MVPSQEISVYHVWKELRSNCYKKLQLVECLLACSNIKDEGARTTLLNQLPSWASNISSHSQLNIHVTQIVDTCLEYRGGLEQLVDVLFFYEEGSMAAKNLSEVLQELCPLPIAWAKVTRLKSLFLKVHGLPKDEILLKICQECLLTEPLTTEVFQNSKEKEKRDTLIYLTDWLVRKGQRSTGEVPILEFVKGVMKYVNTPELETWVNEVNKHFSTSTRKETVSENHDCSEISTISFLTPLHLVMVLEPKSKKSKKYDVQVWLFEQGKEGSKQIYVKENITLKELPEQIKQARGKVSQVLIQNPNSLTLEFFLPIDLLLNHNIEEEYLPKSTCPISFDYCVLVRPLERLHNEDAFFRLCQVWNKGEKLQQSFEHCAKWLTEVDPKWGKDLGKVFSLNFKPDSGFLGELIGFGTPIVMWIRDEVAKEWHFKLYQEWSCCRLADIPQTLYEERRSIFWDHDKKHTGHLSLLWDDPTRVPPSFQLGPPT